MRLKISKVLLILSVGVCAVGGYYVWQTESTATPEPVEVPENAEVEVIPEVDAPITRTPSSPDREVYINQEWRFSFEIPKGTTIRDPESGNAAALLNIGVMPEGRKGLSPVRIFISLKSWMDRLLDRKEGDITIGGLEGWYYQSVTMSVIPYSAHNVLVNNEYWVHIGIQNEYLPEFQMVLDTFEFHDPIPTLDELGIKPPMPTSN